MSCVRKSTAQGRNRPLLIERLYSKKTVTYARNEFDLRRMKDLLEDIGHDEYLDEIRLREEQLKFRM